MQFRKLAAVAGSALMTGLTMAGPALAAVVNVADIGDMAGVTDTTAVMPTFVVGADAAPADVAAAINLAAYLAGNVYKTEKVAVEGAAAVADGAVMRTEIMNTTAYTRDFDLIGVGNALSLQPTARGGRPATFLKEGTFTISGTEYKYYEKIEMVSSNETGTAAYYFERGSAETEFENAKKDLGFRVPNNDIIYKVTFDTSVPVGTNNLTGQTIKFLGTDYTVTYSSTTKLKLSPVGGAVGLKAGESATVGDYTVTCDTIATASGGTADAFITVCKGDVCSTSTGFLSGDTKDLTVGTETVPVTLQSVAYGASVSILVGQVAFELKDGQSLDDYPDWKADIDYEGNTINWFSLTYKRSHTSFSGTYPVLTEGQSVTAPTDFFVLKNMGLESRDYHRLTATADQADMGSDSAEGVFLAITDPDTGSAVKVWDVGGGTFSDTVAYDLDNGGWYYLNTTGGYSSATSTPRIQLTEKTLTLVARNTTDNVNAHYTTLTGDMVLQITEPQLTESGFTNAWYVEIDENYDSTGVPRFENVSANGPSGDTSPTYLYYGYKLSNTPGNGVVVAYGGTTPKARSGGFTSDYGAKFVSGDKTQIILDIPKAQTYGDLLLGREAAAAVGEIETKTPIQITFDVAKLDTEIADPSALTTDVVVMGGPAVNRLAAQLLDKTYPAKGVESGIPENAALVQVFQDAFGSGQVAVLIAGWEAEHTDLAVAAIQAGKVTQAEAAVKVSGTVAAPSVEAYTAPAATTE